MKKFITLISVLLFAINGFSTHLVGGTLHYKYLGKDGNSNNYKYKIVVTIYRDCIRGVARFDPSIKLCAYGQNSKSLVTSFDINLDSFISVDPVEKSNCPLLADNICLEKATYTDIITLPASSAGYILKWERCCRNAQVNLPNIVGGSGGNQYGQSYLGYIPNTSINNSSPYFTEVPVPFMCLNDTTQMKNFAIDPDGDSLVYSLIKPNAGASSTSPNGGTAQTCAQSFALKKVSYTNGFSETQPFGSNGYSAIDPASGLTTYMSTIEGNFSVAVEVKEYRNNVLLGTSILDLQVLVFKCELNAKPQYNNGFKKSFQVNAGDKLCFTFSGIDSDNKDSITMKVKGDLFTGVNGFKGTKATFTDSTNINKVLSQFCWDTDCDQDRSQPYTFNIELRDNGCPPKSNNQIISIKVNPFVSKIELIGDSNACEGEFIYKAINAKTGSSYEWEIEGGTIISGKGTGTVKVKWDLGTGKITVKEIPNSKCIGDIKEKIVKVTKFVSVVEILGDSLTCEGEFDYLAINGKQGSRYVWEVEGGTIVSGIGSNSIKIKWDIGTGKVKVKEVTKNGCTNNSKQKNITITNFVSKVVISGDSVVCNGEFIYQAVNGEKGSTYSWELEGGNLISGQGTNSVKIKWELGAGKIKIKEVTENGCSSSENEKVISVEEYISNVTIIGDSIVCNGEFIYLAINGENKSTYSWEVEGGVLLSGQGTSSVKIKWELGAGKISIKEVTKQGCTSSANEKIISVIQNISNIEIIGDTIPCDGKFKYHLINGEKGSTYSWEVEGGTLLSGQGTDSIRILWNLGIGKIIVKEITKQGCTSAEKVKIITISPFDSDIEIIGDEQICEGKEYTYTFSNAKEGSTYKWEIEGGTIISGQGTDKIKIKWTGKPIRISLQETNKNGCQGSKVEEFISNYNTQDPGYWWGNVITPNGDGKNDCFNVYGLSPECNKLEVKIVNRWGQIVFESKGLEECWDGTLRETGNMVATGTYYYILKLEIDGGDTIDTHGTVTVLY